MHYYENRPILKISKLYRNTHGDGLTTPKTFVLTVSMLREPLCCLRRYDNRIYKNKNKKTKKQSVGGWVQGVISVGRVEGPPGFPSLPLYVHIWWLPTTIDLISFYGQPGSSKQPGLGCTGTSSYIQICAMKFRFFAWLISVMCWLCSLSDGKAHTGTSETETAVYQQHNLCLRVVEL